MTEIEAKVKYVKLARSLRTYGVSFFLAKVKRMCVFVCVVLAYIIMFFTVEIPDQCWAVTHYLVTCYCNLITFLVTE